MGSRLEPHAGAGTVRAGLERGGRGYRLTEERANSVADQGHTAPRAECCGGGCYQLGGESVLESRPGGGNATRAWRREAGTASQSERGPCPGPRPGLDAARAWARIGPGAFLFGNSGRSALPDPSSGQRVRILRGALDPGPGERCADQLMVVLATFERPLSAPEVV